MTYCRFVLVAGLLSVGMASVLAQDARFPTRTISIVVANAAGGGTDYLARLVGQKLQDRLGQSVIIENKPGANSMIAAQAVIRAAPDGHTLLMGSIGMLTVNPAVVANLSYDTQRLCADLKHRAVSADPDRQCRSADQERGRARRLRQGQPRQGQCRRLRADLPGGAETL